MILKLTMAIPPPALSLQPPDAGDLNGMDCYAHAPMRFTGDAPWKLLPSQLWLACDGSLALH